MGTRTTVRFGDLVSALYETFLEQLGDEERAAEAVVRALERLVRARQAPEATA